MTVSTVKTVYKSSEDYKKTCQEYEKACNKRELANMINYDRCVEHILFSGICLNFLSAVFSVNHSHFWLVSLSCVLLFLGVTSLLASFQVGAAANRKAVESVRKSLLEGEAQSERGELHKLVNFLNYITGPCALGAVALTALFLCLNAT